MNTMTRQITVGETDYQCAKKIVRLVREFEHLRHHMPDIAPSKEEQVAVCNKFFNTLISREAFKELLGQHPKAEGRVDEIMEMLSRDMWVFLKFYFDVAEEPSELPMWYVTKDHLLLGALSVFNLDNYGHGPQSSVMRPFKDIIEIILQQYDSFLLLKQFYDDTSSITENEEPIITEIL